MELGSPRASIPAVLAVLGDDEPWTLIHAHLEELGVLADRVKNRAEALAAFLDRGGHEGLLSIGAARETVHSILDALREIDPTLTHWCIDSAHFTQSDLRDLLAAAIP